MALPRAMDADLLRRAPLSLTDYRVLMFLSESLNSMIVKNDMGGPTGRPGARPSRD